MNGKADPEQELRHELVHAVMRTHVGERHEGIPRWFRERIAVHFAGQGEAKLDEHFAERETALDPAKLTDGVPEAELNAGDYPEAYLRVLWMSRGRILDGALPAVMDGRPLESALPVG